jgi:hypothetical protein
MTALSSSQILDDCILLELDKFQIGSIKKRIVNELVEFKKTGACIHVVFEENFSNFNNSTIKIYIIPNEGYNIYSFTITRSYPFNPPIHFNINNKDYKQFLKINSSKTIEELRTYYGIQCLCCSSIYCSGKWSPGLSLKNFINEFKKMKNYRRDIITRLLVKKIVDKYLVTDLHVILIEWLL